MGKLKKTFEYEISEKLEFIALENWRYKGAYGGRGGQKSWGFADGILCHIVKNKHNPIRILCTREIQNTIKASVHQLLSDRIVYHKLENIFDITDNEIRAVNGSFIIFKGLRTNTAEIKSLEGIDICWVEEAESISQDSLDILIPTIRKEGSEIWFSWNTRLESDPVYKMLVTEKRPDCKCVKVIFSDNPWFPETLEKERLYDKKTNEKKYNRVWLGNPATGGLFFSNFDPDMMSEQPFVVEKHLGERRLYGGFDYGWGKDGWASFGFWYADNKGVPHRMLHWYKNAMTASEQADDLYNEIESFHFTGQQFPTKIWYDYEMDNQPGTEPGAKAPIMYFKDRWKKGGQNPNVWVPCNKKRVNGWQIVTDYLGIDIDTSLPKMRYWEQYNKQWKISMQSVEEDENNPLDVKKCDIDHPCDETRYLLVGLGSIEALKAAEKTKKDIIEYQKKREAKSWKDY